MGKITGLFLGLIFSSSAMALTAFDITAKVLLNNGETAFTSHIITKEGQKNLITNGTDMSKTFVEVTATSEKPNEDGVSAIYLQFVVGKIEADGTRKILSNPRIATIENEAAKVSQGNHPGDEQLSVTVVAKRVEL